MLGRFIYKSVFCFQILSSKTLGNYQLCPVSIQPTLLGYSILDLLQVSRYFLLSYVFLHSSNNDTFIKCVSRPPFGTN